eukprot:TRINITY_DN9843_c0_g1_i1.p1 TRINITY_DN9843_c0_g1~~TRINITY_DN9843_c0_g1_i1.p1  ORF type:complete len:223 (-),score=21.20 TRINITY_DN9843_c0_g1_i1:38-706(-)
MFIGFQGVIAKYRPKFHASRTAKSLEAHYYRMKRIGTLEKDKKLGRNLKSGGKERGVLNDSVPSTKQIKNESSQSDTNTMINGILNFHQGLPKISTLPSQFTNSFSPLNHHLIQQRADVNQSSHSYSHSYSSSTCTHPSLITQSHVVPSSHQQNNIYNTQQPLANTFRSQYGELTQGLNFSHSQDKTFQQSSTFLIPNVSQQGFFEATTDDEWKEDQRGAKE